MKKTLLLMALLSLTSCGDAGISDEKATEAINASNQQFCEPLKTNITLNEDGKTGDKKSDSDIAKHWGLLEQAGYVKLNTFKFGGNGIELVEAEPTENYYNDFVNLADSEGWAEVCYGKYIVNKILKTEQDGKIALVTAEMQLSDLPEWSQNPELIKALQASEHPEKSVWEYKLTEEQNGVWNVLSAKQDL